jgi:ATP-dependent exoDNAse (exonuclease V) beta subunit
MSELLVYRASAGSGKTFRLAAEYIKLLMANPESYRRILAVTFTNKATAEMKGRILEELKRLAGGEISPMGQTIASETGIPFETIARKAELALTNILHDYSRFSVSTIDSFVQRIIQALLWELGQQGGTEIQLDYKPILERATDILLDESAQNQTLFRWLQTMGEVRLESEKSWDIRNTLIQLGKELFSESFRLLSSQQVSTLTDLTGINKLKGILKDQQEIIARSIQSRGMAALDTLSKEGLATSVFFQGSRGVYGFFEKCSRLETGTHYPLPITSMFFLPLAAPTVPTG